MSSRGRADRLGWRRCLVLTSWLHLPAGQRLITAAGLESTFIRPGMYASNAQFWWVPGVSSAWRSAEPTRLATRRAPHDFANEHPLGKLVITMS
jgi:hypothetical protein